jgi:hypothetical protein
MAKNLGCNIRLKTAIVAPSSQRWETAVELENLMGLEAYRAWIHSLPNTAFDPARYEQLHLAKLAELVEAGQLAA